jgi:hypothetical protein
MKKHHCFSAFLLVVSLTGSLSFSALGYAGCSDLFPDEFLDLCATYQPAAMPLCAPPRTIHLALLCHLKNFPAGTAVFFVCLRC